MNFMPAVLKLTPLAIAIGLLSACASNTPNTPSSASKAVSSPAVRQSAPTLADLENQQIVIEKKTIAKASTEDALKNYQAALALYGDSNARLDAIKRMAELTLHSSQVRDYESTDVNQAGVEGRLNQSINTSPTSSGSLVSFGNAISLYKEVLQRSTNTNERIDAYYQLAKAYDMNGQRADSINTLRQLLTDYPNNPHFVEAEFRVAEDAFSHNRFLEAADRYERVYLAQSNKDFKEQARYKQGWALYKASDYNAALPVFFSVAQELDAKQAQETNAAAKAATVKLLEDTDYIISLTFLQLDGPKAVQQYFAKSGRSEKEADIYMRLGLIYLEKRMYKNAAETFEFFTAHQPLHERAPEFGQAVIRTYFEGGFPSEVIPAKERFIERYGLKSNYYANANANKQKALEAQLLVHIIDLAKHYHASAQATQSEAAYLKAAHWYREHLAYKPAEADAIAINQLLAEALFSAKHYGDAITEFEKTAYEYKNPKARDSAYFALLAYQEQAKAFKGSAAEEKAWFERRTVSSHKYAQHFPADKDTAPVLKRLTNDQIARKDVAGAIKTADIIVKLNPPAPVELQLEAWQVIADGNFDTGNAVAAEQAYIKVLGFNIPDAKVLSTYQGRLTASIYKQAEAQRSANEIDAAVANFLRASQSAGSSPLKPMAQYDAANLLYTNDKFADAVTVFESFRKDYPTHELTKDLPVKIAIAYEKSGQLALAAHEYEQIAHNNLKAQPELSRESLWVAAELYEKAEQRDESMRVYRDYVKTHPAPMDLNTEAQFKLLSHAEAKKDEADTQHWLKSLAQTYDKAGAQSTPRINYLGAMAHFRLSEPLMAEFNAITLNQPLRSSLALKRAAMQKALAAYTKTAAIGVAEYTTASNYQIAELYRGLASSLMGSEKPKGLNELELEQYEILLEEQALPFEDKALEIYTENVALTTQGIYDDYIRKSFAALAKLSPGRYNKHEQLESHVDVIY